MILAKVHFVQSPKRIVRVCVLLLPVHGGWCAWAWAAGGVFFVLFIFRFGRSGKLMCRCNILFRATWVVHMHVFFIFFFVIDVRVSSRGWGRMWMGGWGSFFVLVFLSGEGGAFIHHFFIFFLIGRGWVEDGVCVDLCVCACDSPKSRVCVPK